MPWHLSNPATTERRLSPYTDDSQASSITHTASQPAMRPMIDLIYSVLQGRPLPVRSSDARDDAKSLKTAPGAGKSVAQSQQCRP